MALYTQDEYSPGKKKRTYTGRGKRLKQASPSHETKKQREGSSCPKASSTKNHPQGKRLLGSQRQAKKRKNVLLLRGLTIWHRKSGSAF